MRRSLPFGTVSLVAALLFSGTALSQSSTGTISGTITDPNNAVIAGATVTATNTATGFTRSSITDSTGLYRFVEIPTGTYVITIDAPNFSRVTRKGITLDTSQAATVNETLTAGSVEAAVTVNENASMLNTTTAEVDTRFDSRRLSEVPISPSRNAYNILHSSPGVNVQANGQTSIVLGASFSANGARTRSNNFLLDGQDNNDPALSGGQMPLNNPDAIQAVRIVTSQFLPEYGQSAGSVTNIIGKSGTNEFRGSLFWFHNNENLNACSNTDKRAGFCDPASAVDSKRKAPLRRENQVGFTLGGPAIFPRFGEGVPYLYSGRDRTFFFVDHQRWTDRRSPSRTIPGAPTAEGRNLLQMHAGGRPHVQALLRFVPAGVPNGEEAEVQIANGAGFVVPLGDLTETANSRFRSDQGSVRIDHRLNEKNLMYGRYRYSIASGRGFEQIAPSGHGTAVDTTAHALSVVLNSSLSPAIANEARIAWKRYDLLKDTESPLPSTIPSIQITELGMSGAPESETRTAIGRPVTFPVIRTNDTYQLVDALSVSKGSHTLKFGGELRRVDEAASVFLSSRGNLLYKDLSNFVNDIAESATRTMPLPGSDVRQFYRWHEFYVFAQDQWKVRPDLTLSYGIRYEYPGDPFSYLRNVNRRVVAANNNPVLKWDSDPRPDTNNWMPRVGFNWNPRTTGKGLVSLLTGGDRLVVRGGYARAFDPYLTVISNNVFASFPFSASQSVPTTNAFANLARLTGSNLPDLNRVGRGIFAPDFRSPEMNQFSIDIQRELAPDLVFRIGYVGTRGTGLYQTVNGNPFLPCPLGEGPGTCNRTGINRTTGLDQPERLPTVRVDPTRGPVTVRSNSASSTYDSLQTSLEKRFSGGFGFGVHYTWSVLLDTSSDVLGITVDEPSTSQDPFATRGDRARSAHDRPHRLAGNVVYELPFFTDQKGLAGKILGGWQINAFFNFQSGAPFSVINGSDPSGTASAAARPNVFTNLDISGMSVAQLYHMDRRLQAAARAQAEMIFARLPPGPCSTVAGWLPEPLPYTLFSAPRGRVTCLGGIRQLTVDFIGILEGQRVGNAGRNILRADSLKLVDLGLIKNTQVSDRIRLQFWVNAFNAFNARNFGIPSATMTSLSFLDQWATDGGSRRIVLGARAVF